eukprot:SAG22_NODE_16208_length_330_cov_4.770563_1_plen_26_part_01
MKSGRTGRLAPPEVVRARDCDDGGHQ